MKKKRKIRKSFIFFVLLFIVIEVVVIFFVTRRGNDKEVGDSLVGSWTTDDVTVYKDYEQISFNSYVDGPNFIVEVKDIDLEGYPEDGILEIFVEDSLTGIYEQGKNYCVKYYEITKDGIAALKDMRESWSNINGGIAQVMKGENK